MTPYLADQLSLKLLVLVAVAIPILFNLWLVGVIRESIRTTKDQTDQE
jgi:hypothetical protein